LYDNYTVIILGFHIGSIWRWNVMTRHVFMVVPIIPIVLIRNPLILWFTEENVQLKSDSNAEKPAEDQGMRIVFTFLGVFGGVLILVSIFIVSYCIHRRRNVNKQISNGMHNYNIILSTTLTIVRNLFRKNVCFYE